MPIYEMECVKCGARDVVCKYSERDAQKCECGKALTCSEGRSAPRVGKAAFQMQGVLGNGDHIKGHFGKPAKKKPRSSK